MPAISATDKNTNTLELFSANPTLPIPEEKRLDKPVNPEKMEERKKLLNKEADSKTYSREEAVEASMRYFKNDDLAANVWINKYALKDSAGNLYEKSPEQMHQRLAKELARVESKYPNPLSEEEIYNLIKDFKYLIPQGGPMSGIGNNHQYVSLSNCFVIGPGNKSDSYGAILLTDEEQVQLMKRRGGVGHDLTHIRPKGTSVMNSALTSTGIVPFMERYSNTTREVAQDGRRGALMLSISVNHPDAESFIDAKQDKTKVTGANVSVKLSDDFMKAVESNTDFIQKFPVNSINPLVEQTTNAKGLWDKIVHNAWASAEPGVLFWDTIIKESIPDCYSDLGFETVSTNPCLTADSWVMTEKGPIQIVNLIGKKFNAWVDGKLYPSSDVGFFSTGAKDILEIETAHGLKLRATGNHKFKKVVSENRGEKTTEWVELINLSEGDTINLNNNIEVSWQGKGTQQEGWLLGSLLGDGCFENELALLRYWGETRSKLKEVAVSYIQNSLSHRSDLGSGDDSKEIITVKSNGLYKLAQEFGIHTNKVLTNKIEEASAEFYEGFLSGWFDADGTVLNNKEKGINVRLSSSDLANLEVAQRMLLRLGIFGKIYKNRREKQFRDMPDGKGGLKQYETKAQHELIISKDNIHVFHQKIGFKDEQKKNKLTNVLAELTRGLYKEYFNDTIKSITYAGIEEVYDCQINTAHEFDANGFSVHNCGEIPLCPYDSCRLLAINLYSYVDKPFTDQATFNFDKFKNHVHIAQRLMDDIVDLEAEKIDSILTKIVNDPEPDEIKHSERKLWEKIKKKTLQGRRTGLGITAEGDMLAALGITYGTDEATSFAENVQKSLALAAYASSVEMAEQRGAFEIFDTQREKNNPFINRIKEADPALYQTMVSKGRRNIALLTIAPTGTTSLMTQTSSGLEPVFQVSYKRRKKVNPTDKDVKVSFTDETGDAWEEYFVVHHKFKIWLEKKGYSEDQISTLTDKEMDELVTASPYHNAMANDIDWIKKVQMQGKVQKWVDHSISVTVNVPKETPESVIHHIYMEGWKQGCKGMTVYRDGSRDGVLISKEEKTKDANEFTETAAPKRPKTLDAKIIRFNNNHEKWLAVVGMLNNKPYEIFTGKAEDAFHLPNYVATGEVIKNLNESGTKRYDFRYKDKDGFNITIEGLSRSFTTEFWNYAKLISGMLRHGMPLKYAISLVNNLELNDDSLNTWKNGVVRALSKMLPDGSKPKNATCTECGEDSLIYEEGCLNCKSCGHSKCG